MSDSEEIANWLISNGRRNFVNLFLTNESFFSYLNCTNGYQARISLFKTTKIITLRLTMRSQSNSILFLKQHDIRVETVRVQNNVNKFKLKNIKLILKFQIK